MVLIEHGHMDGKLILHPGICDIPRFSDNHQTYLHSDIARVSCEFVAAPKNGGAAGLSCFSSGDLLGLC
jgi:hypothetical protein